MSSQNASGTNTSGAIASCFHLIRRAADTAHNPPFSLNVDVHLPGHGITAIWGPSGSGKTTFLRCIAGLEKAEGELTIKDEVWQSAAVFLPTHRRSLGYVFQEASLFPHLNVEGNLRYALKRAGQPITADVYAQVLQVMGIETLRQRYSHQLSGGERQRVAIARALLIQPKILLMDEPLGGLDRARKQEILPYLEQLHKTFEIPVLYVSHAIDEVARLADHILVLERGQLVTQGSATSVFSQLDLPLGADEETGVILHGEIIERDARWHLARVVFSGGELWIPDGNYESSVVRIRVLASDVSITLSPHDDSSILNQLAVEITALAADRDTAMTLVQLRVGGAYLLARLSKKSVHHLQLEAGKQVWIQIKAAAILR